jgi:N-acetylmuramoyl-L-alanine amidase
MATGQQLLELANKHRGEKYVFGARVNFMNQNYKGPWDCAEFISWVVYQVSGLLVGVKDGDSYTGYWKNEIGIKCTEITINVAKRTPGAIFLRFPSQISGHIAFSDGKGRTVEAMDKNNGVKSGNVDGRSWDTALLINGVDYSQNNGISPYVNNSTSFSFKNPIVSDNVILRAKEALLDFGIDAGILNDEYNEDMEIAIYNFQLMKGLVPDGIMGPKTMRSLEIS